MLRALHGRQGKADGSKIRKPLAAITGIRLRLAAIGAKRLLAPHFHPCCPGYCHARYQ